jgi:hypothetical protein
VISLTAICLAAAPARALSFRVEGEIGAHHLDPRLRHYSWATSPGAVYGAALFVSEGPFTAGLRATTLRTTQAIGQLDPGVRLRTLELAGRFRVFGFGGLGLLGEGSGGRLDLRYSPDRVVLDPGGDAVRLSPVGAWTGSGGAGLELKLGPLVAGLHAERAYFSFETAHLRGSEVVKQRERFHNDRLLLAIGGSFGGGRLP